MAFTILQQRKRQRYLVWVLIITMLLIPLVFWYSFLRKAAPQLSLPFQVLAPSKIKIDWQALEGFQVQDFQPFEEISSFEGEVGRENPFIPF